MNSTMLMLSIFKEYVGMSIDTTFCILVRDNRIRKIKLTCFA